MSLSAPDVRKVLASFGSFRFTATVHGFDLDGGWRLVHGGGIAGHSRVWWIEKKNGSNKSRTVTTTRQLRRLITEWLAEESCGQRPTPLPGCIVYAKKNENRFGQSFVWVMRTRQRRASSAS